MKRSEIVTLIEDYLWNTEHLDIPCSLSSDFKAAAKEIILIVEKAGMLPPPIRTDAVTSSIVYCYYPEVEEIEKDGTLDIAKSKLWEDE